MNELTELPPAALGLLGILVLAQFGLQIWAVVDIYRRPASAVAGGRKVVWLLVVLLTNLLGPLLYLAVGRRPVEVGASIAPPLGDDRRTESRKAVDLLYGERGEDT